MDKLKALLYSRRAWLAVASVIAVLVNELVPVIDTARVSELVMVIAAWIVGDSLRKTA